MAAPTSTSTSLIGDLIDPSAWTSADKLTLDNYHIWSHKVGLMLRHHNLNKYIRIKTLSHAPDALDVLPSTEDTEHLSLAASYIQQTMSTDMLAKFVNSDADVVHNSRKLWKKLADAPELVPKGKAAFIRFHIQLGNLRVRDFKEPAEFVAKISEVQKARKDTGVKLTDDIEAIAALVKNLPRELEELGLKWRLGDYADLTATEAASQVKDAQEAFDKLPKLERPRGERRPEREREPRREREFGRRRGGGRGADRRLEGRRVGRDRERW